MGYKFIKKEKGLPGKTISLLSLALFNTALSMFITYGLFIYGGSIGPVEFFQFASHCLALNLFICIVLYIFSLALRRSLRYLAFILYGLLQVFLLIDVKVYELFHFHINSLVLNTVFTEDFSDSVILGHSTLIYFSLEVALILFVQSLFIYVSAIVQGLIGRKLKVAVVSLCLLAIAADKIIYAFGNVYNMPSITRAARLYPLYQPLKADKTLSHIFNLHIAKEDQLRVSSHGSLLNYPKNPLIMKDDHVADHPNIIVIAVEGFRHDMLDPLVTPNLWKFSRENITFKNHYSGGNGSRAGIFSLLYGLQGTYWHSFLIERKPPLLIDSLRSLHYDFKVLSATSLNFPEFRQTAFVQIPDSIEDHFPPIGAERDNLMTDEFLTFLDQRNPSRPFFSFMFFNASHQPYKYPKAFEKFTPVSGTEINYAKEITAANSIPLKNRYKNALYFDDSLFGKIFTVLMKKGLLKNTIVIITGDHGEEFLEQGFFGHTSSFDDYQTKVVFVMHMPGMKEKEITKLTSHLDFVPTVMKALGYTNPISDYSQGIPLLDKERHSYVFSAGWDRICIIDEDVKIVSSTETYRNLFEVFRSKDYQPVPNRDQVLKQKKDRFSDVLRKMSDFYR